MFDIGRAPTADKRVAELCEQAAVAMREKHPLLAKALLSTALMASGGEDSWYILCRRAEVHLAMDGVAFAYDDAKKALQLMPKKKERTSDMNFPDRGTTHSNLSPSVSGPRKDHDSS